MMSGFGGMTTTASERAINVRYLTGLTAMALSLEQIRQSDSLPLLFASAFLFLCCTTDTFLGEIPNPLNLTLILIATLYYGLTAGAGGVATALLGLLLGGGLLLLPYLLGGMGGGDVKALAALGALLGPAGIFQTFLYASLIGGLLALLYLVARMDSTQLICRGIKTLSLLLRTGDWSALRPEETAAGGRFPYAVSFCFGFVAHLSWGDLL
jgi:prepilin peptidase CpaA